MTPGRAGSPPTVDPTRPPSATSRSRPAPASRRCSRSWPRSSRASRARRSRWSTPTARTGSVMFLDEVHDLKDRFPDAAPDRARAVPREPGRRAALRSPRRRRGCARSWTRWRPPTRSTTGSCAGPSRWSSELRAALVDAGGAPTASTPSCSTPTRCRGRRSPRSPAPTDGAARVTIRLDGRASELVPAPRRRPRAGGGAAGARRPAVRLQGRRLRHLPGPAGRGHASRWTPTTPSSPRRSSGATC